MTIILEGRRVSRMEFYVKPAITELLTDIGGLDAVDVFKMLTIKGRLTEDETARILGLHLSKARQIFQKFYSSGLVKFEKIKQKGRKDALYIWYLDRDGLNRFFKKELEREKMLMERLNDILRGNVFMCPQGCTALEHTDAMEHNFLCPKCGQQLRVATSRIRQEDIYLSMEALRHGYWVIA